MEWGEYRIEEVLQWQTQKEIDPLKLEELKDESEMMYPFYGQSTTNNGIISYNQLTKKALNNENGRPTILIHSNNQNIVYLETPFYLKDGHGATSVLQCEKLNSRNQMFIVASIDRVIKVKYSYNNKATKIELKNTVINLPAKNGKIDFDFMESFIAELEALRIAELEVYLSMTGLKDYTLTAKEERVLESFKNGEFVWGEFRIGDLFEIGTGSLLSNNELSIGETPRISAKSDNNGILNYFDTENLPDARHFENFITVNFFGADGGVFYHPYKASIEMKVHTLKIPTMDFNVKTGNFIASALKIVLNGFGYGNQLSSSKLKNGNFKITLPTNNQKPDYAIMEVFISAIQKLVIRDVVLYADRKIAATKLVISK
ncbi:restriction endonuclease subunit S [Candidatus Gracilibacteria bacterium]|nr:restriction endonuclease subunit S [Candidatus Gracilibacteria bacterium]